VQGNRIGITWKQNLIVDIVYGINPVLELLEQGSDCIEEVSIARGRGGGEVRRIVELARVRGIPISFQDRREIERRAGPKSQGVFCICREFRYAEVDEIIENRKAEFRTDLVLILDSVFDPQNLGSLIRTGLFFGANGVIIPEHRAAPVTPSVIKASSGAAYRFPVARVVNLSSSLDYLKKKGFWIYGSDPGHGPGTLAPAFEGDIGLVLGSEGKGIRPLIRNKCDFIVSVPGAGLIDSLNVAVAGGILLYLASQKRKKS